MLRLALFFGHAGKDAGAIDTVNGAPDERHTVEVEIVAGIGGKICTLLDWLGLEYVVCDGCWETRLAKSQGCDGAISVHADWCSDDTVHGPHVIHYPGSLSGIALATWIDHEIDAYTPRSRRPHGRKLKVLAETECPAILVEYGFLSCPTEEALLAQQHHQRQLAFATVAGWRGWAYS